MQTHERDYRQVFPRRHAILAVVHVANEEQALRNACLARAAGCDGVFLINHGMQAEDLLEVHRPVHKKLPDWWIGVNCLGVPPPTVFSMIDDTISGVWVDDAGIDEEVGLQPEADSILKARQKSGWQGLYFGGVAFKYCRHVDELEKAARLARRYMDVVTTSGPGTGQAAEPDKLCRMRAALGTTPLGLASGVTPDNVKNYLPFIDCMLVATGISRSFTELDPAKVRSLVENVRGFKPA